MSDSASEKIRFRSQDVVEIALGACVMAFPVATTEEVWNLGAELSLGRVLLFSFASLFFLAILVYGLHGHGINSRAWGMFTSRVATTYFLTLSICALLLYGVDRLELLTDPIVGFKRTILVAFPASFAATVVDGLGGNHSQ